MSVGFAVPSARTVTVAGMEQMLRYLAALGYTRDEVLAEAGIDDREYRQLYRQGRVPVQRYSSFWRACNQMMSRRGSGLLWAGGVSARAFHLMCQCMITASTLGESLGRAESFMELVADKADRIWLRHEGGAASLAYDLLPRPEHRRFIPEGCTDPLYYRTLAQISGLLLWHQFSGWLIGQPLRLSQVSLRGQLPEHERDQLERRVFLCPVRTGEAEALLRFDADWLDERLVRTPEALQRFLDTAPYELVRHDPQAGSVSTTIRTLIGDDFRDGCPTFEEVARRLHMSPSSLRRRLLRERSSYQQIKDEARREVAIACLRRSELSIREIAERLGFMEPGSFSRSFRHWTGLTPQAFRERLGSHGEPG